MTFEIDTVVNEWLSHGMPRGRGKTGVTADRDKIEFRLFNFSSIFNLTLREDSINLVTELFLNICIFQFPDWNDSTGSSNEPNSSPLFFFFFIMYVRRLIRTLS